MTFYRVVRAGEVVDTSAFELATKRALLVDRATHVEPDNIRDAREIRCWCVSSYNPKEDRFLESRGYVDTYQEALLAVKKMWRADQDFVWVVEPRARSAAFYRVDRLASLLREHDHVPRRFLDLLHELEKELDMLLRERSHDT